MARDTRTRILAAAEKLFADAGSEGVSLRQVARVAGVNPALVHYHFGSRDALIEGVVLSRLEPIQRHRCELLDALRERDGAPEVRELVEVLVGPLAELVERRGRGGRAHAKLLASIFSDRKSLVTDVSLAHFGDSLRELGGLLGRCLPELPPEVLARRIGVCVQATLHTLADPEACDARELVDFLVGGLLAPVSDARAESAA